MSNKNLSEIQEERLAHIDFCLNFLGSITRNAIMTRFGVKQAAATRDFALYLKRAPGNMKYEPASKLYLRQSSFKSYCNYHANQVLQVLSTGFSTKNFLTNPEPLITCELSPILNTPKIEIISELSRAIYQRQGLNIRYCSNSSGFSDKLVFPFAFFNNELKWYVRAFDRKKNRFSDFAFTRISNATMLNEAPLKTETKEYDKQWNRFVALELVPHPNLKHKETIEADYDMSKGVFTVEVRAAIAPYLLRVWNVDCSQGHTLRYTSHGKEFGTEFQLWLRNWQTLYGVENAPNFAPGYQSAT